MPASIAAIIVASGPSLSDAQCTLIERAKISGAIVIAINDSYKRFGPHSIDYVYAADGQWWRRYHKHVIKYVPNAVFLTADRAVCDVANMRFVTTKIGRGLAPTSEAYIHRHHSSTHQAVGFAVSKVGARKILLVGVDCKADATGKKHWFGDHPKEFRSPQPFEIWIQDWSEIAISARDMGLDIVNCSLDTAVDCFRKSALAEEMSI